MPDVMLFYQRALFFEDFAEGQTFVSPARTITETDIALFCGLSGDYNPFAHRCGVRKGRPLWQTCCSWRAGALHSHGSGYAPGVH